MGEKTNILWTDATFNPWEGCQEAGPGCDHCYAKTLNARFGGGVASNWGPSAPRRRTSAANWRLPLRWDAQHNVFFAQHGRRQRVFCASLADVFDNAVDPQWRVDLFELIRATPNLDWLLLTKRIGNVPAMVSIIPGWLPENVWLGATICNQEEADRDIPKLLVVPAAKRFLSMEPLLGAVDLTNVAPHTVEGRVWHGIDALTSANRELRGCIDWVIVGGESGPGARPMHPDWARSLRDQCVAAGVPYFFKQWGEWLGAGQDGDYAHEPMEMNASDGPVRVGKKAAGRLLDGREWNEVPI